ncbi:MAG: bifunctional precorrin-2 dehydrogenase/sirohydrochlorin ferrochelatase [Candidatus Omnitrophota bacterium]|nr:bifunctional precorrin-2 dehydrogenase/sirohydrochlorin ferrochelatase [Candidatus Omnitrophota bacterium]
MAVRMKNKKAVIVGGGNVAERKALSLLEAEAKVRVISPVLTKPLTLLAKKKKISWVKRTFGPGDLEGADIIIAATSDRGVNKRVSALSRKSGKLINVVDDKALSDFISPAVFTKEKAIVAVYTDGREPELSRDIKNFLKEHWDDFLSFRNRS